MKNRPLAARLGFALAGIRVVWQRERSFRTQACGAVGAAATLMILHPGTIWIALILLAGVLVLALEMVNSALEYLIDHIHPAMADPIRCAKDAAAGAVLLASIAAALIGVLMLIATLTS